VTTREALVIATKERGLMMRRAAIALGHPLGGSGARIATTLIHHMRNADIRYGLQTMCEGTQRVLFGRVSLGSGGLFDVTGEGLSSTRAASSSRRDTGVALGLVGDAAGARRLFARYIDSRESDAELEWRTEIDEVRYEHARSLSRLVEDRARFGERSARTSSRRERY
jgi:hypothetical protein